MVGKRVCSDHMRLVGGGKRLGHIIGVDWKWFGKVKDHVSNAVSRFVDESLNESIDKLMSGES